MYLDTNGPDGYVDISQLPVHLEGNVMNHSPSFFGIDENLYEIMFGREAALSSNNISYNHPVSVDFDPDSLSRSFAEESVSEIKQNAPNWFKTGNRLITKQDYEFMLKANNAP